MAAKAKPALNLGAATREAFGRALVELGRENKDIVACDADLAKSTMTVYFQKEFPERFFSYGIAEANMVAQAAGMAYAGKIPFVASFSAFVINKGFEQLRVCVAYPRLNVKVVGTHSGISIGEDGPSQMSVEETGLACSLPGFVVLSPADEPSTKALVHAAAAHVGPVFIRTGRPKVPMIYGADQKFEIGKAIEVMEGSDVTIIANGLLVAEAIRASESLEAEGIHARVLDMHTVKPLDREAIRRAAVETGAIVTAE
ncbi:MAG TPA: transketolase C-terminal domain-containing protein, partial [Bryobacteraceae bacterium]|nr:transketolase C-terminal domain-containing protein [Bryobacteraceae bacterium]